MEKYIESGVRLTGNDFDESMPLDPNCSVHGVEPNDEVALSRAKQKGIFAKVYRMDHSVPCVGYGIVRRKSKLKAKYTGMNGSEIGKLRKEGVDVTEIVDERLFVFCGDTTPSIFSECPELLLYPVVVVECSFLYEKNRDKAMRSKHTLWSDLKPVVVAHPDVRFILIHFSMRYSKEELVEFFKDEGLQNVELMLQDEGDEYGSTFGLK